jgi:predicted DNA-binding protein
MVRTASKQETDQFLFRLPSELRERLAQRAAANSRSMAAEVIEAIEKHLTSADRVTQLWELFGKHQQYIEAIPSILSAIGEIEGYLEDLCSSFPEDYGPGYAPKLFPPKFQASWKDRYYAHIDTAALPLLTADQVQTIKTLLKETDTDEEKFLHEMMEPRIEDIRGFDFQRARKILEGRRRITADQVQTIKTLLKETDTDEEKFLAAILGDGRLRYLAVTPGDAHRVEDIRSFEFEKAREILEQPWHLQRLRRNRTPT